MMTSLPGAGLAGVDRRHRGDRGTMTSFPALALPAVDRRHHGHGRGERGTCEPWGIPHTGRRRSSAPRGPQHVRAVARRQVNDDQLARCRSTGTAARASRGNRGTRPGPGVSFPPSIVGTTGTAAGNVGTAGTVARCQVNDD